MNILLRLDVAASFLLTTTQNGLAFAEETTQGFNHKIPEQIMTPNKVKTRIGDLNFYDGIPTAETLKKSMII